MALNELIDFPDPVTLVPNSGVQFLDFGFKLDRRSPLPQDWGFYDPDTALNDESMPQVVRRGGEDPRGRESYGIDIKAVLAMVDRTWLPLPLFWRQKSGAFFKGPTNWARVYVCQLDSPDERGNQYRVVVALDTTLMPFVETEAYLAPSASDAKDGRPFALPPQDDPHIDWFCQQEWVRFWAFEAFKEMKARDEQRRTGRRADRAVSDAQAAEDMQGKHEHVARYRALLDLLHQFQLFRQIVIIDRETDPRPTPIDVDFVLDLGNSRSCGLLIEREPNEMKVDITRAVALQLRDLSRPELVYREPFDSRVEFNRASFGRDQLSHKSGRAEAFSWPTVVRVGPEAARLAGRRQGSEGASGMSSPKRYLWDDDRRHDSWRFNTTLATGELPPPATGVAFTTMINEDGEALHLIDGATGAGDRLFPSIRALYSRRNLMSFALAEILLHALVQINSASHRVRRPVNANLPRRLRRIILTMPTAMSVQERLIFESQAKAARDLVYLSLGLAQTRMRADGQGVDRHLDYGPEARIARQGAAADADLGPPISVQWDEASATQAVYLYTQIQRNFSADARAFFDQMRHPNNAQDPARKDKLRIATIDVGGGTTDLVITTLTVEGPGTTVTISPKHDFREGFNLAGDDAVLRVVREHVISAIRTALMERGTRDRADATLNLFFGGDRSGILPVQLLRRQQFALQIATPIALSMLHDYERYSPLRPAERTERRVREFFRPGSGPSHELIEYLNDEFRREGFEGFDIMDVPVVVDLAAIDLTVRGVFLETLQALGEVVWRYGCDLLLLSGRPSRLPAVKAILDETGCLPAHRIVPLHQFRVGTWYPFRDYRETIADPKTTAAVGAMVCLLGEGQLVGFNFRARDLKPGSTARVFGKIDKDRRLPHADEFYRDMQLDDPDWDLPQTQFEFRGPMALGFRQLPADWWPATALYFIDYRDDDARTRLNDKTPLRVTLRRARRQIKSGAADGFEIDRIEDSEGRTVPPNLLRLRLQTIDEAQGYWLDTGIILGQ